MIVRYLPHDASKLSLQSIADWIYNRFVRWRRAGVCNRIMDALAAGHDPAVQMIGTSVVRVHQHGACSEQSLSSLAYIAFANLRVRNSRSLNFLQGDQIADAAAARTLQLRGSRSFYCDQVVR
jgi:hypothetical protein